MTREDMMEIQRKLTEILSTMNSGDYVRSPEVNEAFTKVQEARMWLRERIERVPRGGPTADPLKQTADETLRNFHCERGASSSPPDDPFFGSPATVAEGIIRKTWGKTPLPEPRKMDVGPPPSPLRPVDDLTYMTTKALKKYIVLRDEMASLVDEAKPRGDPSIQIQGLK